MHVSLNSPFEMKKVRTIVKVVFRCDNVLWKNIILILLVVRTDFISEFFAIIDIFPMASLSVTASSDEARIWLRIGMWFFYDAYHMLFKLYLPAVFRWDGVFRRYNKITPY